MLNPSYRDLLNHVEVRPLDYDYLMRLPPGPQRFYELLSFQIYGALASGRSRAKMLYSDYCKYAPQVRYFDFEHLKKQMFKIHIPHRESGYIAKVEYQVTTDAAGKPDWEMLYSPGPKAVAEYEGFTNKQARLQFQTTAPAVSHDPAAATAIDPNQLAEMTRRGITEKKARELLANIKPQQEVMDQLEYVDTLIAKDKHGRVENPPGLYVFYISDNIAPPTEFPTTRKRRLQEQAQQVKHAEHARAAQLRIDYESYCSEETRRFIREVLPAEEYRQLSQQHSHSNRILLKKMAEKDLEKLTEGTVRAEIQKSGRVQLMSYDEFAQKQAGRAA